MILSYQYRYELRNRETTVATGHLSREQALQVGDRIELGGSTVVVREISPILHDQELRLVVQLEQG